MVRKMIDTRAIDFVSFTGSVEGGRQVHEAASSRLLEMGRKDPAVVREGANFEFTVCRRPVHPALISGTFAGAIAFPYHAIRFTNCRQSPRDRIRLYGDVRSL